MFHRRRSPTKSSKCQRPARRASVHQPCGSSIFLVATLELKNCVIELLEQAKSRKKLPPTQEELRKSGQTLWTLSSDDLDEHRLIRYADQGLHLGAAGFGETTCEILRYLLGIGGQTRTAKKVLTYTLPTEVVDEELLQPREGFAVS